jgi:hypothetical protein
MPQAEQHVDGEYDQEKRIDMPLDRNNERVVRQHVELVESTSDIATEAPTLSVDSAEPHIRGCQPQACNVQGKDGGEQKPAGASRTTGSPKLVQSQQWNVDVQHQDPLAATEPVGREKDLRSVSVSDLDIEPEVPFNMDEFINFFDPDPCEEQR